MTDRFFKLPDLGYGFKDLQPHISEGQLRLHYEKHHQGYVSGANAIFEMMDKARAEGLDFDMKSTLKALSFNMGGHRLHSIFWSILSPRGGGSPGGRLADVLDKEYGSFERFRKEFTQAASSVEGSGWAALGFCRHTGRPVVMQVEKHNVNSYPGFKPILVLDVWEHAYYLDYKNERGKFIEAFWNLVGWDEVERRFEAVL